MAQFITFVIATYGLGVLFGVGLLAAYSRFQLKRGKLPGFLKDRKSELTTLLKE